MATGCFHPNQGSIYLPIYWARPGTRSGIAALQNPRRTRRRGGGLGLPLKRGGCSPPGMLWVSQGTQRHLAAQRPPREPTSLPHFPSWPYKTNQRHSPCRAGLDVEKEKNRGKTGLKSWVSFSSKKLEEGRFLNDSGLCWRAAGGPPSAAPPKPRAPLSSASEDA